MARAQFTSDQIASILEEHKQGKSALELCRKYAISDTTFYKWRKQAGLSTTVHDSAITELRNENARLKEKLEEQMRRIVRLEELQQLSA
ncbi:MAG: transposase [Pseudomonadota bacterium]